MDEIPNNTFKGCKSLREIIIPQSIKKICNNAFSGCTSLITIAIPPSVVNIGNYSFSDCTSLTTITIPQSVKEIGNNSFSGCTTLKKITIPSTIQSIGENCFDGCISIYFTIYTEQCVYENCKIGVASFINQKYCIKVSVGRCLEAEDLYQDCAKIMNIKVECLRLWLIDDNCSSFKKIIPFNEKLSYFRVQKIFAQIKKERRIKSWS